MAKPSIIKNSFYSFILLITNLFISLITAPYISSVLGAAQLGRYNFINAFASWFSIFSVFGISLYGVRIVAKVRDDKDALSKAFSELIYIRIIFTAISLILFGITIISITRVRQDSTLALIQCGVLLLNVLSIDWLYQGLEDYRYIAIRSLIFRAISVGAIFLFVKTQNHIIIYASIAALSLTASNIVNIFYLKKRIKFYFRGLNIKQHMKPLTFFFITAFFLNIYMMIDQTLLGFLKTDAEVALLARARMFLTIALSVTASINSALMPNLMARYEKDKNEGKRLMEFYSNVMLFFSIPISIGTFFIAKYVLVLIGSEEFLQAKNAMMIFSLSIVTVSLGSFNYAQRIMVYKKESLGIIISAITAGISLLLNILLIGKYGIIGCAVSYVVAEHIGNLVWYIIAKKIDGFNIFLRYDNLKYYIAGLIMIIVMYLSGRYFFGDIRWMNFILQTILGASTYLIVLAILKEPVLYSGIRKCINVLPRRKKNANDENKT